MSIPASFQYNDQSKRCRRQGYSQVSQCPLLRLLTKSAKVVVLGLILVIMAYTITCLLYTSDAADE